MSEYEIDDLECPDCETHLHSRSCSEIMCEGGVVDESDEDYLLPGTAQAVCDTCKGTGIERWCPGCGKDFSGHHFEDDDCDEAWSAA
jgi:hypothetical protein